MGNTVTGNGDLIWLKYHALMTTICGLGMIEMEMIGKVSSAAFYKRFD